MAEWTEQPAKRLIVDGKALEYACWGPGPGSAPSIVLLHEALGSVALWRDLPQRLVAATGMGVVAYSRAGFGRSDPVDLPRPHSYHQPEANVVLPQIIEALNLQNTVLVGHSDGATIAAIHAADAPDGRLRGTVLIAPHFFTEAVGIAAIAEAGRTFVSSGLRGKLARYHDHVDATFRGWHDTWTDPDFADWNIVDVIGRWRVPVLAVQGAGDQYATLDQVKVIERCAACPVEVLILPDCGHVPQFERPDETIAAIAGFVAGLNG